MSMRKLLFSLLAIVLLGACTEDMSYYENDKQAENEILLKAKELVENQGSAIPLPVNGTGTAQSRSGVSSIVNATPLWDNVKSYNIDGMQVLMVDLQTAEEVYSRIATTKEGVETIQESTTFSKLVIRKKGVDLYANVLTYLPESNYAVANEERLDTIGYYPYYVDYTGVTLTSSLDGTIFRGIRYEDGKMAGIIYKEKPAACAHEHHEGETCNHEHSSDNYNIVSINLFTQSSQQPMSRAAVLCSNCHLRHLDQYNRCPQCDYRDCPQCGDRTFAINGNYCVKCGLYEMGICPSCLLPYTVCGHTYKDFCQNCGELNKECVCDLDSKMCDGCLNFKHECICPKPNPDPCDKCGKETCECPLPDPEPNPDPTPVDTCDICNHYPCKCCDICLTYPCICLTNTTPIAYVAHDGDWIVGDTECVYVTTNCPMAVLEMAHKALGGTGMTQEMFTQFYTQINVMSPNEETILEYNDGFMNQFFSTNSTTDISDDIELGNIVVIRRNGHYLLAFGLQYDGDVIYADLHAGELYAVSENYFNNCDYFTIDGLSSGGKDRMID